MPTTTVARGVQQNGTDVATTPADPLTAVLVGARNGGYLPAARITRDGGQTWADLGRVGDPTDPDDACTAFLTAGNIALSATDPDRMVWSPQSVIYPACTGYSEPVVTPPHVTDDAGQTWRPVAGYDVEGGNWAAGNDFVVSQHLVADAVDGGRFYSYVKRLTAPFGTELWTSADGGETWANACSDCLPDFRFPRLQAHPQTAGEVWAVFRKEEGPDAQADLFRTTDYGASWAEVATADSVWAFGFGAPLAGSSRSTVYAHAQVGGVEEIYYSTDDAATWTTFGGTDDIPIGLFAGMVGDPDAPGVVVAGSTCRGTWVGTLSTESMLVGLRDEIAAPAGLALGVPAPNPTGDRASVEVRVGAGGRLRVDVVDVLGRTLAVLADGPVPAGDVRTLRIDVRDLPPGTYVVRATVGDATATRPLTVVR